MSFTVHELPKAKADKRSIVEWIRERSPAGAASWLNAYDRAVEQLKNRTDSYGEAHENPDLLLDVRQILFKTRRGRVYRALFLVETTDVYILRVRGLGQALVEDSGLETT